MDEECKALIFENETGLEQSVTFQAPGAWTAETSGNWLETSPASGEAGDNEIMVRTCSVNSGEKARTATVRIISGEFSETVTVTQKGRDGVSEPEEEGINRNVTRISILENISFNERRYEYYLKYNEAGAVCDIVLVRSTSASNPSDGTFELREYTHRWTDDYSDNSVTLYAEDYHDIYESSYGEVKRYNLEIPFDENGNPLGTLMPSPYEEASDMRLMAVEYNEDNTLKMLLMTAEGFDTGYPLVAFEWNERL